MANQTASTSPSLVTPYANIQNRVSFDFWAQPVIQASDGTYFCPGFEGDTFAKNPENLVKFGGGSAPFASAGQDLVLPGICTVHCDKEYASDKKKPTGSNGARITVHGIDAAQIEIECLIWTPEQLRQLRNVWAVLFPGNKGPQQARDVSHPTFTMHGVKSMVVLKGRGPDRGSVVNSRIFTISGLEFAKPAATATVTPKGAKPIGSINDPAASYPTPGSNTANTGP
jgi:hypothetical protein